MKKLLSLCCILMMAAAAFAQKKADWQKNFPSRINWYMVSDAGVLLVATKDGLYGLSPEGQEIWKNDEIENIKESNLDPIDGTPYISLAKQSFIKSSNKVIDVVSGTVVANSDELGFHNVLKRLYLPQSNQVLFYGGSKNGVLMTMLVNLTTGQKVWEQGKLFEKNSEQIVSEAYELPDAILVATNKNIYKLNKATGEVVYSIDMKSDLPVARQEESKASGGKIGGLGGVLGKFGGIGKVANTASSAQSAASGFGGGLNARQTATSADFFQKKGEADKFYFWNQDYITGFSVADGKEFWKRVKLPSPVAYILQDGRGFIVATKEKREEDIEKAGKKGIMGRLSAKKDRASLLLLDPATGAEKWNGDVDLKGDILAYRMSGSKLILGTQQDDGDNYISIVDLDKGASITKKPMSIKGTIRDLQIVPQGLYYRTTDQINILDIETGDKTWKKGFSVKNCIGYNESAETGYVSANGVIYKVDFKNGDLSEWIKDLKFERGEDPITIGLVDENVFIASDQNAALYDKGGNRLYHTYVPAPGRTLTGKLLSGLGGVASLAVGAAATAQTAQLSYAKGYYGSTDPQLDSEIKRSKELGAAGFQSAVASFRSISKRFNATKQANNFIAMLTNFGNSNQAKDAGISIVDKTNGKRIADMVLGDKKDPDYTIDDLGRVVYYHTDGNTIEGFKF